MEFEKTFKLLYPGFHYKKRQLYVDKDELLRQRDSFKISSRTAENFPPAITPSEIPPTVTESAPVNMPPPESKPPKKAASKSASINNSKFVDDSLKEIIRPGKVTRSKKEQIEKPQPSPEIEVIANPN
jgi:hypothetical protein